MSHSFLYTLIRHGLFALDPETAHHFSLEVLKKATTCKLGCLISKPKPDPRHVMGITFPNPIGLAAGLDKNGAYLDGLAMLGFGFIEIGTVTPRPQPGNPKPRLFRLPEAQAIINRMGFNNEGIETLIANVQASRFYQNKEGVLGLNIGKNADTPVERAVEDYLFCLKKAYPYAHYITINISSPNTKNLRQLQNENELNALLSQLREAQLRLSDQYKRYVPIVLKIAPDLEEEAIHTIAKCLIRHNIDGIIATNTTLTRHTVQGIEHAHETGGLSGTPVFLPSNQVIHSLKQILGNTIPIIGVGGILSGKDAQEKIDMGASLVQLYTGLIYRGPRLIQECASALSKKSLI